MVEAQRFWPTFRLLHSGINRPFLSHTLNNQPNQFFRWQSFYYLLEKSKLISVEIIQFYTNEYV